MTIFLCVDDKNGMMFNKRRQSSDRIVRQKMAEMSAGNTIFMNSYSKGQFVEENINVSVDEVFLDNAGEGDFCFVENVDISPYYNKIKSIVIFKWNKVYPSDRKLDISLLDMNMVDTFDFEGSSHDRITVEVWTR